ncbi:mechanosensitive ion channel domain-containing protein [Bremerella sp. JC817]|uniref:mechanosensitive ion channel domain-containing protein n=1 Tax=Bremerella sp. JC817 TaxID=3231756 RepID=UPI0034583082
MLQTKRLGMGAILACLAVLSLTTAMLAQQPGTSGYGPIPLTIEGNDIPATAYEGQPQQMPPQQQQYAPARPAYGQQPMAGQYASQQAYGQQQPVSRFAQQPQAAPPMQPAPQGQAPFQPNFGPASTPQPSAFAAPQPNQQPAAAPGAAAVPGAPSRPDQELTLERVESLRKEAEEAPNLDEEKKKKIADLYRDAAAKVKEAQDYTAKAASYAGDSQPEALQKRMETIKTNLAELQKLKPETFNDLPLADLEQRQAKQELDNTAIQKERFAAENEAKRRAERRKELRQWMVELPNKFAALRQAGEAVSPDENPLLAQAIKTNLAAQSGLLYRQYVAAEAELAKYDAEDSVDLVRFERDLAAQRLAFAEQTMKAMAEEVKRKRAQAAQEAVRQAREQLIMVQPALRSYAESNQLLAETSQEITRKLDETEKYAKKAEETLRNLQKQFRETKEKVDQLGLTSSIGVLLRKQRTELIEMSPWRAGSPDRQAMIDEAQFKHFEYDDQRDALANPEVFVQQVLAESKIEDPAERAELEAAARDLFERQRDNLDGLLKNNTKYLDKMIALNATEQQTAKVIAEYQNYIDKRVLWIRSGNILATELQMDASDKEFLTPESWTAVGKVLWTDMNRTPIIYVLVVGIFLTSIFKRGKLRSDLRQLGETAQKAGFFGFWPTIHAIFYSILMSAINPAFVAFIAWRLMVAAPDQTFAIAVGNGLFWTAVMWFPLELLRNVCRGKGLGESHFKWPESSLRLLGKSLAWLIPVILPLTFVTSTFYASDPTHGHDAIERVCFIIQAIVLAAFLGRILHPTGVFQEYIAYNQGGWFDRLKYVWYWGAVSAPLGLAVLAFWGYYYTAQVLQWRLFATLCCVMAMMLIRATLMRWVMLARRKMSIAQARERAAAAAAQSGDSAAASLSNSILAEQAKEDLSAHSAQTQRLLATGMFTIALVGFWVIWGQVLPALSMLDRYGYDIESSEQVADADMPTTPGMPAVATDGETKAAADPLAAVTTTKKITILTMAFSALILGLTLVFARDIPGLMEMTILQRLPLEPSVRYAITSLTSYAIVMIGIVWAFSTLGLQWSQIQWLATALTFGLAFGLQEMFANFVAGIIILFERPIRVGDIVTIHDVTGVVSRIRIRATSITNWDRKEYVVPNKEFITGRLLNWTLSDTVNRVVINVGVAYGTDTDKARKLLIEIADRNQFLLKDPAPMATFEGFGDSTLNLTLRAYLPNLENRMQVITDLHTQIDRAYRDAKIEIAFPQRDLHIRTAPGSSAALGIPEQKEVANEMENKEGKRGAA